MDDLGDVAFPPDAKSPRLRYLDRWGLHFFPSLKVSFYMDPSSLWVIPGSHRSPLHEACWSLDGDIPATVNEGSARQAAELSRMAGDATAVLTDPSANAFGLTPEEIPHHCVETSP